MTPVLSSNDDTEDVLNVEESDIRVLLTGFGPFSGYSTNPSWLAVSKLHNKRINVPPDQANTGSSISGTTDTRKVHITTLKVPTRYTSVLEAIPSAHARPPVIPDAVPTTDDSMTDPPCQPLPHISPPISGYDLVMHVGAGTRNLRIEKKGHKTGYQQRDAFGELAPEIEGKVYQPDATPAPSVSLTIQSTAGVEGGKEGTTMETSDVEPTPAALRGFAEGYDEFPDELFTGIKTGRMFDYFLDKGYKEVTASTDAGRYLCDFIFYCSLAEAERAATNKDETDGNFKRSKVLFLHCPPVGEPYDSDEVASAIEQIIALVFSESSEHTGAPTPIQKSSWRFW